MYSSHSYLEGDPGPSLVHLNNLEACLEQCCELLTSTNPYIPVKVCKGCLLVACCGPKCQNRFVLNRLEPL